MANFKRGKSRRSVRCTMCTADRWRGNNRGRFRDQDEQTQKIMDREIRAAKR